MDFRALLYLVVAGIANAMNFMEPMDAFQDLAKKLVAGANAMEALTRDGAFQAAISHEGHNDVQSASWKYLQTECLQQRQDWVVHRFANESCQQVLEIGGYLTPLPETKYFPEAAKSIALYLNVDPSVQKAGWQLLNYSEVSHATKTYRVDLPVTLEEFIAMPSAIGVEFDCIVMLGAWHMQLGNGTDQRAAAFAQATKAAKIVVIESPESVNMEGVTLARPLLKGLGFNEGPESLVNCTGDDAAEKLAGMPGMLKRHMVAFTRTTPEFHLAEGSKAAPERSLAQGPVLHTRARLFVMGVIAVLLT